MFGDKITIKIEGMHCNHCLKSVEEGLKKINGIKKVKVILDTGEATITYKGELSLDDVEKCITDLGFQYMGVK